MCREYFCTWLGDSWWPIELSPTKTGCLVMTEKVTGRNSKTGKEHIMAALRVHEARPGAVANVERALRAVWNLGCAICVYTPNGLLRLIGFTESGQRVTFCEKTAAPSGKNPLPTVTKTTLRNWGGDWRALAADCARALKEKEESDGTLP